MAVIEGGNIITGGVEIEGAAPRVYHVSGAPVGGTTLDGTVAVGDIIIDVDTDNVYEYTEPGAVETFTRIDTV